MKFGHRHCPLNPIYKINHRARKKRKQNYYIHQKQFVRVCVCCSQGFLGYKQHDGCLWGRAECVGWTHYKLMADALAKAPLGLRCTLSLSLSERCFNVVVVVIIITERAEEPCDTRGQAQRFILGRLLRRQG